MSLTLSISCSRKSLILDLAPGTYEYVQRFTTDSMIEHEGVQIDNLIIQIMDLPGETAGECQYGDIPHIWLDTTIWNSADDLGKEQLLFHELGHCILNRQHDPDYTTILGDYIPESIMFPYLLNEIEYSKHHDYYIHELFHPIGLSVRLPTY